MKQIKVAALILILLLSTFVLASCNDKAMLVEISINQNVNEADYYDVLVSSEDGKTTAFRTVNSIFPSILQLAVYKSSNLVTVSAIKDDAVLCTGTSYIIDNVAMVILN